MLLGINNACEAEAKLAKIEGIWAKVQVGTIAKSKARE